MELDTGSAVSIISVLDYKKYLENEKLESAKITLKTYSGELLIPKGHPIPSLKTFEYSFRSKSKFSLVFPDTDILFIHLRFFQSRLIFLSHSRPNNAVPPYYTKCEWKGD
jgi:hypothetical protein